MFHSQFSQLGCAGSWTASLLTHHTPNRSPVHHSEAITCIHTHTNNPQVNITSSDMYLEGWKKTTFLEESLHRHRKNMQTRLRKTPSLQTKQAHIHFRVRNYPETSGIAGMSVRNSDASGLINAHTEKTCKLHRKAQKQGIKLGSYLLTNHCSYQTNTQQKAKCVIPSQGSPEHITSNIVVHSHPNKASQQNQYAAIFTNSKHQHKLTRQACNIHIDWNIIIKSF